MPAISWTLAQLQRRPGDSDAPPSIGLAGHAVLQMVTVGHTGCDSLQTHGREERGSQPGLPEDRKVSTPPLQLGGQQSSRAVKAAEEAAVCRRTMLELCF